MTSEEGSRVSGPTAGSEDFDLRKVSGEEGVVSEWDGGSERPSS